MPTRTIERKHHEFITEAIAIRQYPLDFEMVFLAKFLIQCTLPHSDPGSIPAWTRKNGNHTFVLQAGWDAQKNVSMGYPYGTIPRLLLIWMVTQAKRTGQRRLNLGDNLSRFMLEIGLDPYTGRGKRGDAVRLKEAMRRLFAARISFYEHISEAHRTGERAREMSVAPKREMWWDIKSENQSALWGSWIELSEEFFGAIMRSTVPCDMRALKMLKKSPLALDLYMLCNYIGANLGERHSHKITWKQLGEQLGVNYGDQHDLKRKVKLSLRKVVLAHPGLKVGYPKQGGGIVILPSQPAIPKKPAIAAA